MLQSGGCQLFGVTQKSHLGKRNVTSFKQPLVVLMQQLSEPGLPTPISAHKLSMLYQCGQHYVDR